MPSCHALKLQPRHRANVTIVLHLHLHMHGPCSACISMHAVQLRRAGTLRPHRTREIRKQSTSKCVAMQLELERLKREEEQNEQRLKMQKKGATAAKTYAKGNIALMRRIHQYQQDEEVRTSALACHAALTASLMCLPTCSVMQVRLSVLLCMCSVRTQ